MSTKDLGNGVTITFDEGTLVAGDVYRYGVTEEDPPVVGNRRARRKAAAERRHEHRPPAAYVRHDVTLPPDAALCAVKVSV